MRITDMILTDFRTEVCPCIRPLADCEDLSQEEFDGYGNAYFAETDGFLCIFMPYVPHVVAEPRTAFVDSYYWTSQRIYRLKNELISFLKGSSFENACCFEGSYKALVFGLGIGRVLRNTLIWIKPFGSFFCMEVIDLKGKGAAELPKASFGLEDKGCADCGRCSRACLTGALKPDSFDAGRCVRQKQFEKASLDDPLNHLYGNKLLGCNDCQTACPMNAGVTAKATKPSPDYYRMFDLDEFALACCSPGFKSSEYAAVYGVNYAKPMKILGQLLVAMKNDDPSRHVEAVRRCRALGNPNANPILDEWLERFG
ncbi:MAG: hypothetical protein K6G89_06310 [Clostridia bacterium]|nr:hypothetical protein [Clostridia bacterium]